MKVLSTSFPVDGKSLSMKGSLWLVVVVALAGWIWRPSLSPTDCLTIQRVEPGSSTLFRSPHQCMAQVGVGSHVYVRSLSIHSPDGSKLQLAFLNASDAPIFKHNTSHFMYRRTIGKNAAFHDDVAVAVTCSNRWTPCTFSAQIVFGCFVPCCFAGSSRDDGLSNGLRRSTISCADGSHRKVLERDDVVGYADEESVKFVAVPRCAPLGDHLAETPPPAVPDREAGQEENSTWEFAVAGLDEVVATPQEHGD